MTMTLAASVMAGLLAGSAADAASSYVIDQRYGTLGFQIVEAGLFTSKGVFQRFGGTLLLDFQHPKHSGIDVSADAGSADIPGPGADEMLRSADYFDVRHFPRVHFVSTSITPLGDDRFHIDGTIEIRGVTLPQSFDATLSDRHQEGAAGEVADFLVTGALQRSRFGMVADAPLISDTVGLTIRMHLSLAPDTKPPC